jgi:hypothetical protein
MKKIAARIHTDSSIMTPDKHAFHFVYSKFRGWT